MNKRNLSRRNFLKTTTVVTFGTALANNGIASVIANNESISLCVLPNDKLANDVPPTWAIGKLKTALEAQGANVKIVNKLEDADDFCVVVSGMNAEIAKTIFSRQEIAAHTEAESLCIVQTLIGKRSVLLVTGTDALGLVYALTELADRVNCLETDSSALKFDQPLIERPASRIRSVMRHFTSELEDKPWFYDKDYWRSYLDMLVFSRINRMSFTTGMGYNLARRIVDGYMLFPYPFFVDVPGYDVQASGLSEEERNRNLEMLKFIGEETAKRGLLFQLGIWTLAYKCVDSPNATYTIEGLTDETHPDYCRNALAILLREVPTISGVTFRVHHESGIPEGSESFWEIQFKAVAECGRRCNIDLHAKNMEPDTLAKALATKQPVVISPKYCGEHLGLPYHQASIREHEMVSPEKFTDTGEGVLVGNRKFTRYGYADTLAENRNWDVVFRIWPGTQRFLLNGDPATFAGYGRNASLCGAAGIELCEPLTFKGRQGSGSPGGRCAYSDKSLNTQYDFEKYRYTYRLWGRLGYNPDADPEIWRRALRQEFGSAALAVEKAIAPVSRVLTLFTLAHAPSADCQKYWPEIYTNIPIADTQRKLIVNWEMGLPILFGNVSPFDPQLFMSGDECGTALVEERASGKYMPLEVAMWMESIAQEALENLDQARLKANRSASKPAFRRMEEDVLIQRALALFFASKLRCSVLWRIYEMTGDREAAEKAIAIYESGRDVWAKMAERAKKVYVSDISYGDGDRQGDQIRGHWIDRISEFDTDIADLKMRLKKGVEPKKTFDPASTKRAIGRAVNNPVRPKVSVEHVPSQIFHSGQALPVSLKCKEANGIKLHYRHVNQAERWQWVKLKQNGITYEGEIPAGYTAKRFPLQYYFEIETTPSKATLFPVLAEDLTNVPYFIVRRKS